MRPTYLANHFVEYSTHQYYAYEPLFWDLWVYKTNSIHFFSFSWTCQATVRIFSETIFMYMLKRNIKQSNELKDKYPTDDFCRLFVILSIIFAKRDGGNSVWKTQQNPIWKKNRLVSLSRYSNIYIESSRKFANVCSDSQSYNSNADVRSCSSFLLFESSYS